MLSVFDGKESTLLVERKVHTGSIYSASWKLDSSQIVTCSADKSVKVIDASTLEEVASFTPNPNPTPTPTPTPNPKPGTLPDARVLLAAHGTLFNVLVVFYM